MTRHSNTLVFGTNTSIGVNVGKDASQTPTVQIGFQRQEAAFVPLLANTAQSTENPNLLTPCTQAATDQPPPDGCQFVAEVQENGQLTNRDSYSVLASFGADVSGGSGSAGMTVAQYFATGIAAQMLAESGGANVVTASGSAGKIADAATEAAKARQAEAAARQAKYEAAASKVGTQNNITADAIQAALDKNANGIADADEVSRLQGVIPKSVGKGMDSFVGQPVSALVTELKKRDPSGLSSALAALKAQPTAGAGGTPAQPPAADPPESQPD